MVGPGYVRDILCTGSRHVATGAIRILRMMRGGKYCAGVASKTLLTVKRRLFPRPGGGVVGVVTAHT